MNALAIFVGAAIGIAYTMAPSAALASAGFGTSAAFEAVSCTVARLSINDVEAIPLSETPSMAPIPTALPQGASASPMVRDAIADRIDEFFACVATGDPLRIYALMSQRRLAELSLDQAQVASQTLPTSQESVELRQELYIGPWNMQVLADGRVSAAVWIASEDSHPAPGKTAIWVFVWEGGQWQLDDVIDFILPLGAKRPTPVADLVSPP